MARQVSERQHAGQAPESQGPPQPAWVTGAVVFAGTMMIMIGVLHALAGLAAIVRSEFFTEASGYLYNVNVTAWGWIHLLAGVVIAAAGFAVWAGQAWARALGIALAALSLIANFLFIPYYPLWSLLIIALNVLVIFALSVSGRRPAL